MTTITALATDLNVTPADVLAITNQLVAEDGEAAIIAGPDPLAHRINTSDGTYTDADLTATAEGFLRQHFAQA